MSGYLLKRLNPWHNCNTCKIILHAEQGYLKRNEYYTKLKAYKSTSGLYNASQSFHYYVTKLEKQLINIFDQKSHCENIAQIIASELKSIPVPTKCPNFPLQKFLKFFCRLRIYYLLKFANNSHKQHNSASSSGTTSNSQKKYKKLKNC